MSKFAQSGLDWSDLQHVLAVARRGSIASAAEELGVNRTTVLRRIGRLEADLDFQLFDRDGTRYTLAPDAVNMLQGALAVERTVDELHRQVLGKEILLQGKITLTTTDSILVSTLAPHLASFRKRHPKIVVELAISNRQLSLQRRDADVAVRPGMTIPDHLTGRLIGPMHFGIYAAPGLADREPGEEFSALPWLGMESPLLESPPGRWLQQQVDPDRIVCRADSFVALRALAEAGVGISVLPQSLGELSPGLRRLEPIDTGITNRLWVVTHPDIERSARVSALVEHLCAEIEPERGSQIS